MNSFTATPTSQASESKEAKVLIVDDEKLNIQLYQTLLAPLGYEIHTAGDGIEAIEKVHRLKPDLVLLDVMMPRLNGFEVCRRLKNDPKTRLIPIIMLTALDQIEDKVTGIESGADDFLSKPVNRVELMARTKSLVNMKKLNDNLDDAESILFALARAIEAKDAYTEGHTERVSTISEYLARAIGLSETDIEAVRKGGVLHDIGKIGVPDHILNKPCKLSGEEFEIIKLHPIIGADICQSLRSFGQIVPIIRHHHEKLDGSGYPDGLEGSQLHINAQIVAVVDIFDALTSDRPYRLSMPVAVAFGILSEMADTGQLNQELVTRLQRDYEKIQLACSSSEV